MKMVSIGGMAAGLALAATLAFAQKQPQPKSQKEVDALQAMFNAPTADARIAAADALLKNFADTEFKAIAFYMQTVSAEEKGDFEKIVVYGERTLEANPKDYAVMLILARNIAAKTREFDLDKEEKLGKAEKYAKDAIEISKSAPKPRPDIDDAQWAAAKKDFEAQGHQALAIAATVRKKNDVAMKEYELAISTAAQVDQADRVRLAALYNTAGRHDDAIKVLDEALADAQLNPAIRNAATNEKMKASKAKAEKK